MLVTQICMALTAIVELRSLQSSIIDNQRDAWNIECLAEQASIRNVHANLWVIHYTIPYPLIINFTTWACAASISKQSALTVISLVTQKKWYSRKKIHTGIQYWLLTYRKWEKIDQITSSRLARFIAPINVATCIVEPFNASRLPTLLY